jgi:hypothetical protein
MVGLLRASMTAHGEAWTPVQQITMTFFNRLFLPFAVAFPNSAATPMRAKKAAIDNRFSEAPSAREEHQEPHIKV